LDGFIDRLKQRKVVQWALAYVAASFAFIQVIDIVAQRFGWPEQTIRFVIIALAIGFFVTLVLAWYHGERGIQRVDGAELLIIALVLAIGGVVVWRFGPSASESPTIASTPIAAKSTISDAAPVDQKSIAVLPFANLSDDKSNGYFAEGIQDEILTRLAKVGALKVISRTSTQHYASSPDNLPQIAKELGVANILEGSVQKAADSVHINVQLIRAATDDHLWAEIYNRKLDDIFGVEGEVAGAIATALNAKLTGAEQAAVAKKPTENLIAYEAYLRGRSLGLLGYDFATSRKAKEQFANAVRLDPDFALAWANLSTIAGYLRFNNVDPEQNSIQLIKDAADNALRLQPQLAEAQLAQGNYLYRVKRDFAGAETVFNAALQNSPNNNFLFQFLGLVERRQGKWDQALAHLEKAAELDPRNAGLLTTIGGETLLDMRRFDEARAWLDRALEIAPNDALAIGYKILSYQQEGRLEDAARVYELIPKIGMAPEIAANGAYQRMLERRYSVAIEEIEPLLAQPEASLNGFGPWLTMYLGIAERGDGQAEKAQQTFERLIAKLEPMASQVDDTQVPVTLGMAYALAGRKQAALDQMRRAVDLYRHDLLLLSSTEMAQAQVLAMTGDRDAAIAICERLLKTNGYFALTPAMLRLDPLWDSLRDDPRFQKLAEANTTAKSK
jgi:TolB-like protein/Tfp pilus assembly protein PilF